ncbi:hypothetical protein QTP70_014873, partial [Hemibagrus guttatus]
PLNVLAPFLFTVYIGDFMFSSASCHLPASCLSDDSAIVGLITDDDDSEYRELIQDFVDWCQQNCLQMNVGKTRDAVSELTKEYTESEEPITDDSNNLHKFSYKLEYLLQFDQKDKTTFLGTKKDYWDYFSDCLAKIKGANDGIRFVKSIPEKYSTVAQKKKGINHLGMDDGMLKTSLGKGRAFIRYSLVHQRLADTLQQCFMNQRVTSDWYYSRSPFLKPHLNTDIINSLYELNEVQFDVASRGHDLDSAWPTFARRTLGMTNSPSHVWKAPSRSSSINSLASSYSQAPDFLCSPEFGHSLLSDPAEPLSDSTITTVDELRLELDQSELKQRQLVEHVQQLGSEATELREVVSELQRQLDISLAAQSNHQELQLKLEVLAERERTLAQDLEVLRGREAVKEAANQEIQKKLAAAEQRNQELMAKLEGVLEEKGQRTARQFDSAQKIHELLDGLKDAEKGKIQALALGEEKRMQAERLAEELRIKEQALKDGENKMAALTEKGTKLMKQAEEQRNAMDKLQDELSVREKEASSLQKDLQDLQGCLQAMEQQAAVEKKRAVEEREMLQKTVKKIQHLEAEAEKGKMMDEYKEQCTSLSELNNKLLQTVKKNEETKKQLMESKAVLENDLAGLRASEKQLRGQLDDAKVTVDEREKRMRGENHSLDVKLQKAILQVKESESVEDLRKLYDQIRDLENSLEDRERLCEELQERLDELEAEEEELAAGKADAEQALEKQREMMQRLEEAQGMASKVALLEEQLSLNGKEMSRLQEEVSKQHLEEITSQIDAERSAFAKISADFAAAQDDLAVLKTQNERLVMENAETREGLHRANTEMAELGMTICKLTAEREEAQEHWAAQRTRIHELEEHGIRETDRLNASMAALRQENASLREELLQMEKLPETVLELKEMLEKSERERDVKSLNDKLESLKAQLKSESEKVSSLEVKVAELKDLNSECSRLMGEKDSHIMNTKSQIRGAEDEIQQLKERVTCVQEALGLVQTERDDLKEKLEKVQSDAQAEQTKMAAEIEDLSHTKITLEERLIELIRDKDALWQKSDALEFEQKQRAEEQWWLVDREATHCLSCKSQFTWWLRKHHCRLCGRIFCYYCSNNFVSTRSGVKKERCCRECYTQHSAVVERFTRSEISSTTDAPASAASPQPAPPYIPTPRVTVTDSNVKHDDGVFDIITDEEVNGLYDSDTLSQTTAESQDGEAESRNTQDPGVSGEAAVGEEQEDMPPAVQDAEIHLLKSGELASSVLLHIEEILQFGDASRELLVKSSCYSIISITVHEHGHAVGWVFSSEPKSICFSVVYRESTNTPEEQAKVLIPLTRCNAHKETICGQLKARNPGVYTLIFDNSYSRFISKKVNYHLTTEKPVIYDGSDCP